MTSVQTHLKFKNWVLSFFPLPSLQTQTNKQKPTQVGTPCSERGNKTMLVFSGLGWDAQGFPQNLQKAKSSPRSSEL